MKTLLLLFPLLFVLISFGQPPNYYQGTINLTGEALQQELHKIIDNHIVLDYAELWNSFNTTDVTSCGKVWDIYSNNSSNSPEYIFDFGEGQCGNYANEGDCYNREHSFPKSWFNDQSPMVTDLFHIYPTDGYVNGKRSNYPYGETNSPTWTSSNGSSLGPCSFAGYSGTIFEPINEYKGDLARTYFYMATRYYGEDNNWNGSAMVDGSQPKEWALKMLVKWNDMDPVSQKEIDRNNSIYNLQGNRNPFIDYPEFVNSIWNGGTQEPINEVDLPDNHVTNFSSSFIKLCWSDATGTNLPDGYLIVYGTGGFNSLPQPKDGKATSNYTNSIAVENNIEQCIIGNLLPKTTYYIKIYSFVGSGVQTDYKTNGSIPQIISKTN